MTKLEKLTKSYNDNKAQWEVHRAAIEHLRTLASAQLFNSETITLGKMYITDGVIAMELNDRVVAYNDLKALARFIMELNEETN